MTSKTKTNPTSLPKKNNVESFLSDHWVDSLIFFLLVLVLPLRLFIWRYYFFNHPISKVFMANMDVSILIFALAALFFLFRKEKTWIKQPWFYALFAYAGLTLYSCSYSVNQSMSVTWWTWLASLCLYLYMMVHLLNTSFRRYFFLGFWIVLASVSALWAIRDYLYLVKHSEALLASSNADRFSESLRFVLDRKRVASLMGWPNVQAAFFNLIIPYAVSLLLFVKNIWLKVVLALLCLLMFVAMFFTYSLGVWGALAGSSAIVFLFFNQSLKRYRVLIWSCIAVLFVIVTGIGIQRIMDEAVTIGPRLGYMRSAWYMLAEYPFWGSGWATFQIANRPFILNPEHYSAYTHNSYLQILAESGWLAFTAWMLFVYAVGRKIVINLRCHQEHRWFYMASMVIFLAYCVHNLLSFTMLAHNIALFGWSFFAIVLAWPEGRKGKEESAVKKIGKGMTAMVAEKKEAVIKKPTNRLVEFVVALCCVGLVVLSVRLHLAEHAFAQGLLLRNTNARQALALLQKASALNPYDGRIDVALAVVYLDAAMRQRNGQLLNLSEQYALRAQEKMPVVFEIYGIQSQIASVRGDDEKAIYYRREMLKRAPYRALFVHKFLP